MANQESVIKDIHVFIDSTTSHPRLLKVYKRVMESITSTSSVSVYLVFGPSGVGKTTLCKKVKQTFLTENSDHIKKNPGEIPIISLELPSPDNGKFNWKDFYQRMLTELNEPLIEKKIDIHPQIYTNSEKKIIPNYLPTTAPALRKSLENALYYRNTKVVLLDEAQHFLKMASGKRLQDQMDSLKSLANMTQTKFILFGTYELMQFLNLNGQLSRRTEEIHFPRYNVRDVEDLKIFKNVINTFQENLPYKVEVNLLECWDLLYERSIGCVGILKNWLDKCVESTYRKGEISISSSTLREYAPTPGKSIKMAEEAVAGESLFNQQENEMASLQNILGLREIHVQEQPEEQKKKKKSSNVGRRKPIRDKVGLNGSGT